MALRVAGVEEVAAAAIVGAGGTAAAAAVALASLGAQHVEVVVREPARAADVSRALDALGVPPRSRGCRRRGGGAAVVSTVPIGAQPARCDCRGAAARPCSTSSTTRGHAARPAGRRGRRTVIAGCDVLFWQATVQVELMTGDAAPIAAMRSALAPWSRCAPSPVLRLGVVLLAVLALGLAGRGRARLRRRRPPGPGWSPS